MNKTKIEWCDSTLNPVIGCTYKCDFCYARRLNSRFGWTESFEKPQFFEERLKKLNSKKPQIIFMNSMSDIADWNPEWIKRTFTAMAINPQHAYLFLTKRPEIYEKVLTRYVPPNWWFGMTIISKNDLKKATVHHSVNMFVSIEPIFSDFENITINTEWVIIGAETGIRKNKVVPKPEWIKTIVEKCEIYNIPVFMKESLVPIIGEENMLREFPKELSRRDK